jgi:hypothetical protein
MVHTDFSSAPQNGAVQANLSDARAADMVLGDSGAMAVEFEKNPLGEP